MQGANEARLPATLSGEPPHEYRQVQRFIQNENVHDANTPDV
jgi:hypothetical protein